MQARGHPRWCFRKLQICDVPSVTIDFQACYTPPCFSLKLGGGTLSTLLGEIRYLGDLLMQKYMRATRDLWKRSNALLTELFVKMLIHSTPTSNTEGSGTLPTETLLALSPKQFWYSLSLLPQEFVYSCFIPLESSMFRGTHSEIPA